ncbi:MAG: hypothetical protein DRR11_09375 [Gammaproteobacteria bacterium]|nr:MAG: hypothetical protein DRR11_09375 [Gammaproteobacteria bacterium]
MSRDDICYLPATELLQRFRAKSLSPVEVLDAYIRRYESIAERINPFSHQFFDDARKKAQKAEQKFWRGKAVRKLDGLPVAGEMFRQFGPLFKHYDLFLCPTNALAAVPAEHDQSRDTVRINGKTVDPCLGWVMTLPFNMMSRCPVISLPSGRTRDNVPTGVQLVAATYQDKTAFQFARALEDARGCWYQDSTNRPL